MHNKHIQRINCYSRTVTLILLLPASPPAVSAVLTLSEPLTSQGAQEVVTCVLAVAQVGSLARVFIVLLGVGWGLMDKVLVLGNGGKREERGMEIRQ